MLIITHFQVGFILLVTSLWSLRGALACKNLKLKFDMRKIMERKYSHVLWLYLQTNCNSNQKILCLFCVINCGYFVREKWKMKRVSNSHPSNTSCSSHSLSMWYKIFPSINLWQIQIQIHIQINPIKCAIPPYPSQNLVHHKNPPSPPKNYQNSNDRWWFPKKK